MQRISDEPEEDDRSLGPGCNGLDDDHGLKDGEGEETEEEALGHAMD